MADGKPANVDKNFSILALLAFCISQLFLVGAALCTVKCLVAPPSLYPLDVSSSFSVKTIRNISRCCQIFPAVQNCPWLRTTEIDRWNVTNYDLKFITGFKYNLSDLRATALLSF